MSCMTTIARTVTVHGHVQGVGFRWYAVEQATRLGVTGWITNLSDGTVRCLVQGTPDAVRSMVDWLSVGPHHATVTDIEIVEAVVKDRTTFSMDRGD